MSEYFDAKTIVVTGSSGFIGDALSDALLERGSSVIGLDCRRPDTDRHRCSSHPDFRFERIDVSEPDEVRRLFETQRVDGVFHLAAESIVSETRTSPRRAVNSNVLGTWSVLEAVHQSPSDPFVVVASSDKAYGEADRLPYTEEDILTPASLYGATKAAADNLTAGVASEYSISAVVARCSNVYGPGDRNYSRIIPHTIRNVATGKRPEIRSDGTPVRDYMFIDDAISAYLSLGRNATRPDISGKSFNFGTGVGHSVRTIVNTICSKMERDDLVPDSYDGNTNGIQAQVVDASSAHAHLGWEPQVPFERGIERTIPWYERQLASSV